MSDATINQSIYWLQQAIDGLRDQIRTLEDRIEKIETAQAAKAQKETPDA